MSKSKNKTWPCSSYCSSCSSLFWSIAK